MRHTTKTRLALIAALTTTLGLMVLAAPALAGGLWFSVEPVQGLTQYQIAIPPSGGSGAAQSLLEFPIDGTFLNLKLAASLSPSLELRSELAMALPGESGILSDYDWIDDSHPGVDIYSESRLHLSHGLMWDVGVGPASGRSGLALVAGIRRQQYGFVASDVQQIGFGEYADQTGATSGPVITYEASYTLPYAGLSASGGTNGFHYQLDLKYSPSVSAQDTDDHLLRNKLSTGDSSGTGWLAGGLVALRLDPVTELTGSLAYSSVRTMGWQAQYLYDQSGNVALIGFFPQQLDSHLFTASLGVQRRF